MMENYGKYVLSERNTTNPLIDEPAILFAGRSLSELLISAGIFVGGGFFLDAPLGGAIGAIFTFWILPLYRTRCPKGFVLHFLWALGFVKSNAYCTKIFTFKESIKKYQ